MSNHSASSSEMEAPPIPTFVQRMTDWLQSQENTKAIEGLKRDSTIAQLRARRQEVQVLNDLQSQIRPRLREIPGFWPFALIRNKSFARLCNTKEDLDALGYLTDVELVIQAKDPRAYDLVFTFSENPYFTNTTLTKSFVLEGGVTASKAIAGPSGSGSSGKKAEEGEFSDEMLGFMESDLIPLGCTINWKPEHDLCASQPREAEQEHDEEEDDEMDFQGDSGSFFWWFVETVDRSDLGSIMANDLVPHVIDYFLGLGEDCDSDDDDDSDDSDDEDEDEIEGEEEIDLEIEDQRPRKKAKRD